MNLEKNKKFKSGKSQGKFKLNEKHHVWVQTAPLYLWNIGQNYKKTRKGSQMFLSSSERCFTL